MSRVYDEDDDVEWGLMMSALYLSVFAMRCVSCLFFPFLVSAKGRLGARGGGVHVGMLVTIHEFLHASINQPFFLSQ